MSVFIGNIGAARTADGNIAVSWNWPNGYNCVRVVFVHKLGGRDVTKLTPDELSEVSDLCFTDEFQIAGGKYIYPIGANDAGLLKFRVYCCSDPSHTDFEKCMIFRLCFWKVTEEPNHGDCLWTGKLITVGQSGKEKYQNRLSS